MANLYVVGVILALAGGIANNSGALLQKYAINKIPKEEREKGYFKKLFKSFQKANKWVKITLKVK